MKPLVEYKGLVLKKSEASILKYLEKYGEGRVWDNAVYTLTKGAKERLGKIKDDEIRVVKKT